MDIYSAKGIGELLQGNSYAGRGIVCGVSDDGKKAVAAYFIMGRSENSRNRVFTVDNGEVFTKPFDESKVKDPSLILYAAVRQYKDTLIVTNGDQTDTIYKGLESGLSFSEALASRAFEPDAPNFTPRISAALRLCAPVTYSMSILKSIDAEGTACARYTFDFPAKAGLGHFLHTYVADGNPLPTFQGEPKRVKIGNDIDHFADALWNALDENNKISLYVRYIDLESKKYEERLINKNR